MMSKLKKLTEKFSQHLNLKLLLENKRFTIPFSIAVAVVLWLTITINDNPIRQQVFTDIPANVSIENTVVSEMGLGIVSDVTLQKFSVTLSGPNYVVSALKPEDIVLNADVTEVTKAGTYKLKVTGSRNSAKTGYNFASITPSEIEVTFDFIDIKEFTVTPKIIGAVASEGLIAETPIINGLESGVVTVKGPRSVMEQIDTVAAYASVNRTLSATQTFDAEIKAYDKSGKEIDMTYLVIENKIVKVSVPISKKATLPVKVAFNNLPSGLKVDDIDYSIDHTKVTIIGTPEVVSKMKSVTLSPIDFTSVSKNSNSFEVSLTLPEGVKLLDNIEYFVVNINSENYAEKTFNISNVKYTGLSVSLKANSGSIKNVKICGNKEDIKKLTASDLYAVVDLSDKGVGEYTVSVTIKSDKYPKVWQVGQYNLAVTVK